MVDILSLGLEKPCQSFFYHRLQDFVTPVARLYYYFMLKLFFNNKTDKL